ncbi:MAG TPA: tyrosine-type recombinase/integrase [Candidatus Saccharimonadales bacterium]|nr:tyrosine-type recombinase/integrase [Candidatus Saccharimonadales bacterium]
MDHFIKSFLESLVLEQGRSQNTASAYKMDLNQFDDFLSSSGFEPTDWAEVSAQDVDDYKTHLRRRELTENSVSRKVSAIKSFFSYLAGEGIIGRAVLEGVETPPRNRAKPKFLSEQEINSLIEQTQKGNSPLEIRNRAMVELAYASGLTSNELVSLNLQDIHTHEGYLLCDGKYDRNRRIPVHDQACAAVLAYIENSRPFFAKKSQDKRGKALFLNLSGERMTRQGFWLVLKNLVRAAGLAEDISPRTLRQSFAAHLINGGAPVKEVQSLLGHAERTTVYYTKEAHPRAKVEIN